MSERAEVSTETTSISSGAGEFTTTYPDRDVLKWVWSVPGGLNSPYKKDNKSDGKFTKPLAILELPDPDLLDPDFSDEMLAERDFYEDGVQFGIGELNNGRPIDWVQYSEAIAKLQDRWDPKSIGSEAYNQELYDLKQSFGIEPRADQSTGVNPERENPNLFNPNVPAGVVGGTIEALSGFDGGDDDGGVPVDRALPDRRPRKRRQPRKVSGAKRGLMIAGVTAGIALATAQCTPISEVPPPAVTVQFLDTETAPPPTIEVAGTPTPTVMPATETPPPTEVPIPLLENASVLSGEFAQFGGTNELVDIPNSETIQEEAKREGVVPVVQLGEETGEPNILSITETTPDGAQFIHVPQLPESGSPSDPDVPIDVNANSGYVTYGSLGGDGIAGTGDDRVAYNFVSKLASPDLPPNVFIYSAVAGKTNSFAYDEGTIIFVLANSETGQILGTTRAAFPENVTISIFEPAGGPVTLVNGQEIQFNMVQPLPTEAIPPTITPEPAPVVERMVIDGVEVPFGILTLAEADKVFAAAAVTRDTGNQFISAIVATPSSENIVYDRGDGVLVFDVLISSPSGEIEAQVLIGSNGKNGTMYDYVNGSHDPEYVTASDFLSNSVGEQILIEVFPKELAHAAQIAKPDLFAAQADLVSTAWLSQLESAIDAGNSSGVLTIPLPQKIITIDNNLD